MLRLENRQEKLEGRQERLEHHQERLEHRQEQHEFRQKQLEFGQETMQKNIVSSLGEFTDHIIEHVDAKTSALNKHLYSVESTIHRLARQ
ncbi:hypothetical protein BTR23_08785 [Alkalihalophilus pseudofirmus]|nr:hypothetical protein BTR23_08785 [Alkalihalophilus pseudofirmus]